MLHKFYSNVLMLQQCNTASKLAAVAGLVVKTASLTNDTRGLVKPI